ncbi:hypothetical protein [Streptomyces xanthophaeus]|nr:hypothetical protein [Streptomyces xanthophaeus]WKD33604.1 hypothetical protein KO717_17630 [Streptomyces xanthophaeus]
MRYVQQVLPAAVPEFLGGLGAALVMAAGARARHRLSRRSAARTSGNDR